MKNVVLLAIAGGIFYGFQSGAFKPNEDLINQRTANASSQAAKTADQDDALWRYESGLCEPLVSIAPDQSGVGPNHILVLPRRMPPEGSPAVDHYGQPYASGIFLCTPEGVTAEVVNGKIANVKAAGNSPETQQYIKQWFDLATGR